MNWKTKWKRELDAKIPNFTDSVIDCQSQNSTQRNVKANKRKLFAFSAISFATVLVMTLIVSFFALQPQPMPETVFAVEINPSVAFVIDNKDKVKSVSALNADADVILSTEDNVKEMVGKPMSQAVNKFVDFALQYGYIDLSYSGINQVTAIRITSCSNKNFEVLRDSIEDFLCEKGKLSAVFTKNTTEQEFYDIVGFQKKSGVKLVDAIKKSSMFYAERRSTNKNIDDLSNDFLEYAQSVLGSVGGEMNSILQTLINGGIADLQEYFTKLKHV